MQDKPNGSFISYNLSVIACFNAVLFLGLIAALSSHRQVLQDWARYRQQQANAVSIGMRTSHPGFLPTFHRLAQRAEPLIGTVGLLTTSQSSGCAAMW